MLLLIPLGGIGSRFKSKGYELPKPLINVMGKPIIFWLLDNLELSTITGIIIPYNIELRKYRMEDRLRKEYPNITFIFTCLTETTGGASESILIALQDLNLDDSPILCVDGDNFYTTNIVNQWNGENAVFSFSDSSEEAIYSYIQVEHDRIIDIKEKDKISNLACTGAYGFNSWKTLMTYCTQIIDGNIRQKGEFYTSTVIKRMLADSIEFSPKIIEGSNYICLGTPLHVRIFCNNYPRISALNNSMLLSPKRYCFDLDNTLVTFPTVTNDYSSVRPIEGNIRLLRYLKNFGNTIIIYTARRMKTHGGNTGKLLADIGRITFDTLEKFNIPFDEIYFGKPQADFYIDDLALSAFSNLEKELGFYRTTIDPREFNQLSSYSMQVYKKTSTDLSGEIHYYTNIPTEIKDLFPIMINHDRHNKWYEMEMINGIPISKLYLAEELTCEQLMHIMSSMNRIHQCSLPEDEGDIYANYSKKLKHRFESYDYSRFPNIDVVYSNVLNKLDIYESQNKGKKGVIHGDPVMTNIIINNFGKIKFIDMRGKQGDTKTICGDVMYDYAKLYQSLCGYDEILDGKKISVGYKTSMIACFKSKFIEYGYNWDDLLVVVNSLLFSLIPLHDNEKCMEYYRLIV
jgi:capsule biosynthesis phosphatase